MINKEYEELDNMALIAKRFFLSQGVDEAELETLEHLKNQCRYAGEKYYYNTKKAEIQKECRRLAKLLAEK